MNGNLKPFERATLDLPPFEQFLADVRSNGASREREMSDEELRAVYDKTASDEVWMNPEYQVNITRDVPSGFQDTTIWHLSIKRLGKTPIHDWRDLQQIKNMLVSPDAEAIEIYPSHKRVVDGSNQYHLWVFVKAGDEDYPELPVGFHGERLVTNHALKNGRQRKLHRGGETL